jgi:uncharacterized membrane protein YjdF
MSFLRKMSWFFRTIIVATLVFVFIDVGYPIGIFTLFLLAISFIFHFLNKKEYNQIELLFTILILAHALGVLGLYTAIPLFDDVLHFYGSIILTIFFYLLLQQNLKNKKLVPFLTIILVALAIIGWEFFEFAWDLTITPIYGTEGAQPNNLDTIMDLIWGLLGAVIVILFHINKKIKK